MEKAKTLALAGVGTALGFAAGVPGAFAAQYSLSGTDVTALGGAATDTANSFVGVIVDLLPVLIPLIVVGFVIRFIMRKF